MVDSIIFQEITQNRRSRCPNRLCCIGRILFEPGMCLCSSWETTPANDFHFIHVRLTLSHSLYLFLSLPLSIFYSITKLYTNSNPNEPAEPEHGGRQEKSRFKNIEWTPYENVHKRYLNLGEFCLCFCLLTRRTSRARCIVTKSARYIR